jgi:hypothetical protein
MNNERSSAGNLNTMETDIRALIGDTDPETLRAEVLGVMVETLPPSSRSRARSARGVGATRHAARDRSGRAYSRSTHVLFPETYDVWRQVEKLRDSGRGLQGHRSAARPDPRRRALGAAFLLRDPQGRPAGNALAGLDGWTACAASSPDSRRAVKLAGTSATSSAGQPSPLDGRGRAYIEEREHMVNALRRGCASSAAHCLAPGGPRRPLDR